MRFTKVGATVALLALASGTGSAWWLGRGGDPLPALAAAPEPVANLLYARPFLLEEGYVHAWRAERPQVRSGWVLVLEVDPVLALPREGPCKVLYVGDQTAERVNHASVSGRCVVVVPSELDEQQNPRMRLEEAPIWFGRPALPEQVDEAILAAERRLALANGVLPVEPNELLAARAAGDSLLALPDRLALDRELAVLIRRFSSDAADQDIARGLELPRLR